MLTPAHDRLATQEADEAGRCAAHHKAVVSRGFEHHHLAEYAAGLQMLQNGAAPFRVDSFYFSGTLHQDTQHIASVAEIIQHVARLKPLLIYAQTVSHGLTVLRADALQKR